SPPLSLLCGKALGLRSLFYHKLKFSLRISLFFNGLCKLTFSVFSNIFLNSIIVPLKQELRDFQIKIFLVELILIFL
ncbi:MAG: hypothetical protein J5959_09995, partial [Butyrivibrio sp.]|nr:hypothetical protein [Butyrivibrio sp.]